MLFSTLLNLYILGKIIGPQQQLGIGIGCSKLAALSNGTRDTQSWPRQWMWIKSSNINKKMSHTQPESIRHNETQRLYNLMDEKTNKQKKHLLPYDNGI